MSVTRVLYSPLMVYDGSTNMALVMVALIVDKRSLIAVSMSSVVFGRKIPVLISSAVVPLAPDCVAARTDSTVAGPKWNGGEIPNCVTRF